MELNDEQVMKLKLNESIFIWIKKTGIEIMLYEIFETLWNRARVISGSSVLTLKIHNKLYKNN